MSFQRKSVQWVNESEEINEGSPGWEMFFSRLEDISDDLVTNNEGGKFNAAIKAVKMAMKEVKKTK